MQSDLRKRPERTQVVTLQNSGASDGTVARDILHAETWGGRPLLNKANLRRGTASPFRYKNTTKSTGPQGVSGRQGVMSFVPTNLDGGAASAAELYDGRLPLATVM